MALDFSVLQGMDPAGAFFRGQEAVRAEADRNLLRQAKMEQMAAQRENMLAQRAQRMEEAEARRRAGEAQNALATYAASGQPMTPSALARFGEPGIKLAEALRKEQADQVEREIKVLDYATRRLAAANPQTYPAIRADLARINPQFAAGLPEQFDAEQIMSLARQGLSLKEQIESATRETVVAPGSSLYRGGKLISTAPVKEPESKLFTPEEEAQRIRIALASRPPAQPRPEPAPRTQQVTMSDGTIGIMNMDTGQVTPASLGGAPVKGKPSAFAEKTAIQRNQLMTDLDRTIAELEDAAKPKGLIAQSTGSGAGRLIDVGAAFIGEATPGAIAASRLAPIADMVLKMVPRFEGPQSDKDTKSYKEAAGQLADTSLPTKIRQAAATEIVRLMRARKNQFVTQEMAAEGVAPAGAASATAPAAPRRREIAPGVFVTERP